MDTITHGLLGAVTAQLGFRQRIGRDTSIVAGLAAAVPDLDLFIAPMLNLAGMDTDGLEDLRYHRALSHSLLFVPLLALALAGGWWWIRRAIAQRREDGGRPVGNARGAPFWLLYLCLLVALVSHALLDWVTSYGTQLLLPLTNARYATDSMPIVDIFYTPLLILTLLVCYIVRKVAKGQAARVTLAIGWVGFLLSVAYIGTGHLLRERAVARALAVDLPGTVITADAYPAIGSIFLWRTVVQTDEAWVVARVHQFDRTPAEEIPRQVVPRMEPNEWVLRAQELPVVQTWEWFTKGRGRAAYVRHNGFHVVQFHDMRYGRRTDSASPMWWMEVVFDRQGEVLLAARRYDYDMGEGMAGRIRHAWNDLWTAEPVAPDAVAQDGGVAPELP